MVVFTYKWIVAVKKIITSYNQQTQSGSVKKITEGSPDLSGKVKKNKFHK